jgi:hypothetical protein
LNFFSAEKRISVAKTPLKKKEQKNSWGKFNDYLAFSSKGTKKTTSVFRKVFLEPGLTQLLFSPCHLIHGNLAFFLMETGQKPVEF